jgi:hypothetical protein
MKGIYLTEEAKAEIEAEIKNLEDRAYDSGVNTDHYFNCFSKIEILQEILFLATILPVEESWDHVDENTHTIPKVYPNGVIIQPK